MSLPCSMMVHEDSDLEFFVIIIYLIIIRWNTYPYTYLSTCDKVGRIEVSIKIVYQDSSSY